MSQCKICKKDIGESSSLFMFGTNIHFSCWDNLTKCSHCSITSFDGERCYMCDHIVDKSNCVVCKSPVLDCPSVDKKDYVIHISCLGKMDGCLKCTESYSFLISARKCFSCGFEVEPKDLEKCWACNQQTFITDLHQCYVCHVKKSFRCCWCMKPISNGRLLNNKTFCGECQKTSQ